LKPKTRYTKSGDINIAYQVIGNGPIDIVYIPGWVSNIDMMWAEPRLAAFLIRLTMFSRLILFDKRGTGLSDRSDKYSTLEERMDDILAVMNAVNSKKAVLFSHSEGGSASIRFSIDYPHRTRAIIGFGIFAKRRYSDDYPWAPTDEERELSYKMIEENWADGDMDGLRTLAPSLAHDSSFMDWLASYLRAGASPGAALNLQKQNTHIDITGILSKVKVPVLLLFRKDDEDIKVEEGRYLNEHIPNSKLREFSGRDHLFWAGDTIPVLTEIEEFITGSRPDRSTLKSSKSDRIDIASIMSENYLYDLKLVEFASLCGRSLSSFKRDFSKIYNTTPSRWIKAKRLEYAKSLLLNSDLNINQICYESGFINVSHFIKSFKAKYALTPHQYKGKYAN
jgi:pimeloyl-ACP methyl ester carboxylesterase/AraC-like DNA-binding protein